MDSFTPEQARALSGLSQEKVAKMLGISKNGYIKKEKGESRFFVDEALKFSEIVKIPMEKIIFLPNPCHKKRNIIKSIKLGGKD